MRKNLLSVLGVAAFSLVAQSSLAQTLLFEDFQNGMPGSFLLYDVDGLTPAGGVSYMTAAWIARPDYTVPTDSVAVSTSWYNPAGTSDDWMVTPAVVLGTDAVLEWDAKAQDPAFPDGYEVYVGTDSTPTGLMTNAPIFTVANESDVWVHHSMSLTAYNGQTIHVGFRNNSTDMFILIVDNIKISIPSAVDGGVSAINLASGCGLSATSAVDITITNFGLNAITNFPVSYTINSGTPVNETFTGSIAAGATANYTFTTTADLSVAGAYTIAANTAIPSDGNALNDGSNTTINSFTSNNLSSPIFVSFEPADDITGWLIGEDVDGDGNTWTIVSSAQFNNIPHTGDQAMRLGDAASFDDWTYTTCLDLSAGTAYSLDFWYKKFADAGVGADIDAFLGTSQTPAGMTQMLVTGLQPPDSNYVNSVTPFTVPTTGTYYVGFHGYSAGAATTSIRIDDVTISFATGFNSIDRNSNLISVYPSPANNDLNIRLDQSISDATVEIYNSLGALVKTIYKAEGVVKVDVSSFAKGIYTLNVLANDKVLSQRFSIVK